MELGTGPMGVKNGFDNTNKGFIRDTKMRKYEQGKDENSQD